MTVAPRLAFCPLLVTSIGPDLFALTLFADTAVHPLPHKKEQGSMKYDVLVPFLCTSLPFCSPLTLPWACAFAPAAWSYGAFIFRARRTLRMGCVCFFHFLNWDHLWWAASLEQWHGHKHGCDVDAEELRVPHEKASPEMHSHQRLLTVFSQTPLWFKMWHLHPLSKLAWSPSSQDVRKGRRVC